jgi:quinol monooxygenase YgiN
MWYADEAAYRGSRESPEARAAVADLDAFVDRARLVYLFVEEETVV